MKRAAAVLTSLLFLFAIGIARAQTLPDLSNYLEGLTGTQAAAQGTLSPVDLLYESDSYIPPFYQGRSLSSPGSTMHLQAIAHFTENGTPIPDDQITYTWHSDGRVEGSLSGVGKSVITLPSPTLFGTDTISVDASSADGSQYGSASITVSAFDPQITLYEDHPLFGVEYYEALGSQSHISDSEMTFAAVPYFVASPTASDPSLSYTWSVNGTSVLAASSSNEITVNAGNSNGLATISAALTSFQNPLLDAQGSWSVTFSQQNPNVNVQ